MTDDGAVSDTLDLGPAHDHGLWRALMAAGGADHDALLRRIADERDIAAFKSLFQHFAPRIKAYLMKLGAHDQAADDLAQEAMLALWRKASLYDPSKASATTWIFTIVRNLRIDALRRARTAHVDPADPAWAPPRPDEPDVELLLQRRDEAVRRALAALPPDQAAVVNMAYFSDKPHAEIADALGIPLGTVKSRLRLALERLRASIGRLT